MKRLLYTLIVILFFITGTKAQDYNTCIGLRGGLASGLSVKHFLSETKAIEGIFDSRWHGFSLTGLYEIQDRAFNTDRLNWYYGAGGHIGFWDTKYKTLGSNTGNYTVIGIDGILGLEYNFKEIPINLSVDWKPALNLVGYSGFWGDGGALSIRYIF
jgi:hypothetical protein